jgi:hypothetical protein
MSDEQTPAVRWWQTPIGAIATGGAVLTFVAGVITNWHTIHDFIWPAPQISIALRTSDAAEEEGATSRQHLYQFKVLFRKSGPGVLHDCRYSAWVQGFDLKLVMPDHPLTIPDGNFDQDSYVFFELPPFFILVSRCGKISLNCDKAGSPSVWFRTNLEAPPGFRCSEENPQ